MDKQLVQQKLESLRKCINRIETKRPQTVDQLPKINWEIVFNICHKKLKDFKSFAREINEQI